ncbi:killer toxin Kp4/SMK [Trichoderma evansii]
MNGNFSKSIKMGYSRKDRSRFINAAQEAFNISTALNSFLCQQPKKNNFNLEEMQFFALLPLLYTTAAALGINCRGNANCVGTPECRLADLILQVSQQDPSTSYSPGQHIACCGIPGGNICAFTQGISNSITAGEALGMLQGLSSHGCGQCGSIPFKDNNVAEGQLTVNWTDH